jgi:hypothetical protein
MNTAAHPGVGDCCFGHAMRVLGTALGLRSAQSGSGCPQLLARPHRAVPTHPVMQIATALERWLSHELLKAKSRFCGLLRLFGSAVLPIDDDEIKEAEGAMKKHCTRAGSAINKAAN